MQLTASSPQYAFAPVMMAEGGLASEAQKLQGAGRYGDSMLVHMNPKEVAGLQALAMKQGGSLTINPQTGLPEAFFFMLPALLGALGTAALPAAATAAMGPLAIPAAVGLGTAAVTGSLEAGLMAGAGAFGGAGMAGSLMSLAEPATATIGAMGGAGGAAGGTGLTAVSMPPPTLPVDAASLANLSSASVTPAIDLAGGLVGGPQLGMGGSGVGLVGSPTLPMTAPSVTSPDILTAGAPSQSLAAGTPLPTSAQGISLPTLQSEPLGTVESVNQTIANMEGLRPNYSLAGPDFTQAAPTGLEKISTGFNKLMGSSSSKIGDFLKDNRMNIASSLAPALISEQEEPEKKTYFERPYQLNVTNLSGEQPEGTTAESRQLTYDFVPLEKRPIRAASGGLMSFEAGGDVSSTSAPSSSGIVAGQVSPQVAEVYRSIAQIQQAAGLPMLDLGFLYTMPEPTRSPRAPYSYTPLPSTAEKNYNVYRPKEEDSPSYRELEEEGGFKKENYEYAPGGSVRKKIDRMADPYQEADFRKRRGLQEAAEANFAKGGLPPRFLDDVNDKTGRSDGMADRIKARIGGVQEARLADGEFVIPADVVSHLGNGSSKAGAKKLYMMMDRIRKARTGKKKQAPEVKAERHMPA
jgi:hypothetical protein